MSTSERFFAALSKPGATQRIFDRLETDQAFLPYYPAMLDYNLPENFKAEHVALVTYRNAFPS